MLTEKYKNYIEKLSHKLYLATIDNSLDDSMKKMHPNIYNYSKILEIIEGMGCVVKYDQKIKESYSTKNEIFLDFNDPITNDMLFFKEIVPIDENNFINYNFFIQKLKVLFHEIWHILCFNVEKLGIDNNKNESNYSPDSILPNELSANYFSRAMIMPEKSFITSVINSTNSNGICNIFEVAKIFTVDYTDVIIRGNDLSLWNKKESN